MLESGDCFILNSGGQNGIFAWIGKESSKEERVAVMKSAESFLAKNELPKWTKIHRVVENSEPAMFKQYFSPSWTEPESSPYQGFGRVYPTELIAEFDIASLHAENKMKLLAKSAGRAIGFMPDDAKGQKEIFRIENFELEPIEEDNHGFFFAGDSYVVKYTYDNGHIIYFWQGSQSSQDEKAASALQAVKLDNELNGKAVQVRVVQGCEPRHFIKMFAGKMIIFSGGKASGFKNVHDHDTYDVDGKRLFQVRGTCLDDMRAVQVQEEASSLNSEDVFILEIPSKTFLWIGQDSDSAEVEIAPELVKLVSPGQEVIEISEGEEPDEFWEALGGKNDYSKTALDFNKPILEPRLFHCQESGRVVKISNFEQNDLMADDVMILDSGKEIYVWIGPEAKEEEKENGLKMAKKYLESDPTERNENNTVILTIKAGDEPKSFTCVFPEWNAETAF